MSDFYAYEHEIYLGGAVGQRPALPMTYEGMRERARETLSEEAFGYVDGSAGAERTEAANRRALDQWAIVPRMMRDVSERDLSVELLGRRIAAPVLTAPIGVQAIVHPDAEAAVARATAALDLPYVISTVSSVTMEEAAEAAGDGPRWFQLYWPTEDQLTDSFLHRAADAGYEAVVVTLDTRMLAWRPRDLATAYLPFLHGEGIANYRADPVFDAGIPEDAEDRETATIMRWASVFGDPTQTAADLARLVERSPLPVLVKGVQHPADARVALEAGVDGIIVSNHGGRQVDDAVASVQMLPAVADEVDGEVPVLFDSGLRTGADIAVALALGADAVLIGRPFVWGLACGGEEGVRHVLRGLLAELDLTVALAGLTSVGELTREALTRREA